MRIDRRNAIALIGACPFAAVEARAPSPALAKADAFARKVAADGRVPGLSLAAVLPDGGTVTAVAGMADPERGIAMTPATRIMSGSTGKTFCAATVMALVGQGRLALDRPIAPIFADEPWFGRLPNADALTLRLLLTHRAGFPQFLDDGDFRFAVLRDSLAGRDTDYRPRRMLGFILDEAPLFAAGSAYHYSDLHYHLAGLAIEKVAGRGYYAVLQDEILAPLGTADIVPATQRDIAGLAAGYARGDLIAALSGATGRTLDDAGRLRRSPVLEYTGGGLAVTPRALAQFYWRLARGRILAPELVAEMVRAARPIPGAPAGVLATYGLGLFVTRRAGFGTYLSHSGYYPGYTSNVAYFLDHGLAVAVQLTTDHGPDINTLMRDFAEVMIGAA